MAYHESEFFTPDKVDEQIAASLDEEQTTQPPDPRGTQVVQLLQRHYAPVDDYPQPLARVWSRIEQHRIHLRPSHNESISHDGMPLKSRAQLSRSNQQLRAFKSSRPLTSFAGRLTLIAALVFITLAVGGTFAIFHLARPGHVSGGVHETPTSHPINHPTANTDQVYAIVNNILYRYDATTHRPLWSFQMPVPPQPDYSTYESSGSLYAVRVSDGKQLWRYHAQAGVFSPVEQKDMVFVSVSQLDGTSPQRIVALDITSGTIRWVRSMPAGRGAGVEPQITVGKSFLYVNNSDGQLLVWHPSNGNPVETFSIPAPVKDALDVVAVVTIVP